MPKRRVRNYAPYRIMNSVLGEANKIVDDTTWKHDTRGDRKRTGSKESFWYIGPTDKGYSPRRQAQEVTKSLGADEDEDEGQEVVIMPDGIGSTDWFDKGVAGAQEALGGATEKLLGELSSIENDMAGWVTTTTTKAGKKTTSRKWVRQYPWDVVEPSSWGGFGGVVNFMTFIGLIGATIYLGGKVAKYGTEAVSEAKKGYRAIRS